MSKNNHPTGTNDNKKQARLNVNTDLDRYVYLDLVAINYEEQEKWRTYLHLVESEDGIGLIVTIASNSMFAIIKAAGQGYKVINTITLLQIFEKMANSEASYLIDNEIEPE